MLSFVSLLLSGLVAILPIIHLTGETVVVKKRNGLVHSRKSLTGLSGFALMIGDEPVERYNTKDMIFESLRNYGALEGSTCMRHPVTCLQPELTIYMYVN